MAAPADGRDPADTRTIDLEIWLREQRRLRADRLRAARPDLPMVQLPLVLHDRHPAGRLRGAS